MTYLEAIERADRNRPNAFSTEEKMQWLAALEGKIACDVFLQDISESDKILLESVEPDTALRVKFPHDDLYVYYLEAQIDAENGEYTKYSNEIERYNAAYGDFTRWFARVYRPAKGYGKSRCASCSMDPPYYMSDYALAVSAGYTGTLAEWLNTLKGEDAYVHIKYSEQEPTSDDDLTDTPAAWMGILADHTETASTTYSDYKWYYTKGIGSVESVNGKSGEVVLTAEDVGAAPSGTGSITDDMIDTVSASKIDGTVENATNAVTAETAETATTATKLSTSAGGKTQPVYFKDGVPEPIGYTIETSVPSGAVFKDTTYSQATESTLGLLRYSWGTGDPGDVVSSPATGQLYFKYTATT